MKKLLYVAMWATVFTAAQCATANDLAAQASNTQEVPALAQSPQAPSALGDFWDLERWLNRGDNYSAPPVRSGLPSHAGERIGSVGLVSRRIFQGAVMLYACEAWGSHNRFTSLDFRCEGHQPNERFHSLGFASSTQLPDTAPLYRCRRVVNPGNWTDHFDTIDVNCEGAAGAVNDGLLGYIWR